MHKFLLFFIVAACLAGFFTSMPITADDTPAEPAVESKLTLDRCVQVSLKNNFTLKDALELLFEREADYYIAKNTLQARVSSSYKGGSTSDSYGYDNLRAGGELFYKLPEGDTIKASASAVNTTLATYGGHELSLEYRYPLARGGGLVVGSKEIRKARRNLTIQEMNYFVSKQDVVSSVVRRYFALLQARKIIEVNVSAVESAKDNLRITKRKYEEGMVPKIDLTRAELRYISSEDGLIVSRKDWADRRDDLMRSMGIDPRGTVDIDYEVPYVPRDFLEEECVELSMLLRKELLVTGEELFQKKEDVTIAKDGLKPQVDLVTSYNSLRTPVYNYYFSDPLSYPAWSAMIECSIDISKRSLREELLKTRRLVVLQEEKLAHRKLDVVKEVRDGLRNIRLAAGKVELKESNLKAAEERLHLATRSWEEGLIPNREVVDAQTDLVQAKVDLVQAKIAYILAEFELRKAIGYDLSFMIKEEQKLKKEKRGPKSSVNHFLGVGK